MINIALLLSHGTVWCLGDVDEVATLFAELYMPRQRITGQIGSPSRLSDALNNQPDKFLILDKAFITSLDSQEQLAESCSVVVNKGQVFLAGPVETQKSGARRDVFAQVEKVEGRCAIFAPPYSISGAFHIALEVGVVNAATNIKSAFIPATNA